MSVNTHTILLKCGLSDILKEEKGCTLSLTVQCFSFATFPLDCIYKNDTQCQLYIVNPPPSFLSAWARFLSAFVGVSLKHGFVQYNFSKLFFQDFFFQHTYLR